MASRTKSSSRHNKLYRCPPTPEQELLMEKEKGFVIDNNAVACFSSDYGKVNPKLGPAIPPYNSQVDKSTGSYWKFHGVDKTLQKTSQANGGTSIEGPVLDRFHEYGAGFQYISLRNAHGAGHSRDEVDGHGQFMSGLKPVIGYNGRFGFRRNVPWLRTVPSPFGTGRSPTI